MWSYILGLVAATLSTTQIMYILPSDNVHKQWTQKDAKVFPLKHLKQRGKEAGGGCMERQCSVISNTFMIIYSVEYQGRGWQANTNF